MTTSNSKLTKHSTRDLSRIPNIVMAATLVASTHAFAETETNKTIDRVGVSGNLAYFTAVEGFAAACNAGAMQVDLGTPAGRALYAMVLTAKATNRKLSRIDFSVDAATGACVVTLAETSG